MLEAEGAHPDWRGTIITQLLLMGDRRTETGVRTLIGFDPVYGARPLKRAIQHELIDPLAMALLDAHIRDGEHVVVDFDPSSESLTFTTDGPARTSENGRYYDQGVVEGEYLQE